MGLNSDKTSKVFVLFSNKIDQNYLQRSLKIIGNVTVQVR